MSSVGQPLTGRKAGDLHEGGREAVRTREGLEPNVEGRCKGREPVARLIQSPFPN